MTVALSYSSKFVSYQVYLTRTETAILQVCPRNLTGPCELVELGSGSSTKTRVLLDAYNHLGYPCTISRLMSVQASWKAVRGGCWRIIPHSRFTLW